MPQTILRPLNVGEKLDVSLKLWRASFKKIIAITAPVCIPVAAIMSAMVAYLLTNLISNTSNSISPFNISPNQNTTPFKTAALPHFNIVSFVLFLAVMEYLISIYTSAATFKVLTDTYIDRDTSAADSVKFVMKKLHSVIWINFETTVIDLCILVIPLIVTVILIAAANLALHDVLLNVTIGFYLGIAILAVFLFVTMTFTLNVPILLMEDERGINNIRRSFSLTKRGFFNMVVAYILAYLLTTVVSYAIEFLSFIVLAFGHGFGNFMVMYLIIFASSFLITTTFISSVITVVYIDQRVRAEGFDIEMLAAGLGYDVSAVGSGGSENMVGQQTGYGQSKNFYQSRSERTGYSTHGQPPNPYSNPFPPPHYGQTGQSGSQIPPFYGTQDYPPQPPDIQNQDREYPK